MADLLGPVEILRPGEYSLTSGAPTTIDTDLIDQVVAN